MSTHHASADPKRTPVLMAERRTEHYGVSARVCGSTEPGFVVYRGEANAEVKAHFFSEYDALAYVKWKNGKEPT